LQEGKKEQGLAGLGYRGLLTERKEKKKKRFMPDRATPIANKDKGKVCYLAGPHRVPKTEG
jgi:hypothetical protein